MKNMFWEDIDLSNFWLEHSGAINRPLIMDLYPSLIKVNIDSVIHIGELWDI